jgi:hypothetical protein
MKFILEISYELLVTNVNISVLRDMILPNTLYDFNIHYSFIAAFYYVCMESNN